MAIELTEALKSEVLKPAEELCAGNPHFRLIPMENWHLTLHFFGSLDGEQLEKVKKSLKDGVQNTPLFSIGLKDFGVFPAKRAPQVLWIGVKGDRDCLTQLKRRLDDAIAAMGFPVEERKFHPHLTIARARDNRNKKEISGTFAFTGRIREPINHLTLFRSDLGRGGSKYTVLDRLFLK